MGRPKVKDAKKQYTVMFRASLITQIDHIAEKVNISRSQLMGMYIEYCLAEGLIMTIGRKEK